MTCIEQRRAVGGGEDKPRRESRPDVRHVAQRGRRTAEYTRDFSGSEIKRGVEFLTRFECDCDMNGFGTDLLGDGQHALHACRRPVVLGVLINVSDDLGDELGVV